MEKRNSFFEIIQPSHLYAAALLFLITTFLLVAAIYLFLYIKKRRFRQESEVIEVLDEWIGEAIISSESEYSHVYVRHDLLDHFKMENLRQLAIDRLIETKKNLTGAAADNIVKLYTQLGLREDSYKKMHSIIWHIKAKGIYELYMMNQQDCKDEIQQYTNAANEYVRVEAQTAMLGFDGFTALKFLDDLKYIINDWHQVKLLEQLQSLNPEPMINLPLWLNSANPYVVHFALKLADIYQAMEVHDDVVNCLQDEDEKIRYQAIKTLGNIPNEKTNSILVHHYDGETEGNKQKILKQFLKTGTPDEKDFLLNQIKTTTGSLRLQSIRALAACCPGNWRRLLEGDDWGDIYTIIEQVQYELAA